MQEIVYFNGLPAPTMLEDLLEAPVEPNSNCYNPRSEVF